MINIKKTYLYIALSAFSLLYNTNIIAEESYMGEVGLEYHQYRYDIKKTNPSGLTDSEAKGSAFSAAINFEAVKTDGLPLGEARFLQHVGEARIYTDKLAFTDEYDGTGFVIESESEISSTGLFIVYMSAAHPVYLALDYNQETIKGTTKTIFGPMKGKAERTSSMASLGYFIDDAFLLGISNYQFKLDSDFFIESESSGNGAFIKYVWLIDSQTAVNLEANYAKFTDDDDISGKTRSTQSGVALDYYFMSNASAGISVVDWDDDDRGDLRLYGANFEYFFTPKIAAGVYYNNYQIEDSTTTDSVDQFGVNIKVRF